jgi:predicted PurR-regulated permease PerM
VKQITLTDSIKFLLFLFLLFAGLYYAKGFLVPVVFAGLLSMLFVPLSEKLENKGVNRGIGAALCILLFIGIIAGIFSLLSWQVSNIADDASKMEENLNKSLHQLRTYVSNTLGISAEKQKELVQKQQQSSSGSTGKMVSGFLMNLGSTLANTVLMLVYIFLFMYFRTHLKNFVLKMAPDKPKASAVVEQCRKVSQQYIGGLAMMIVCLWIMYGIGFTIVGLKNALFFAILCGLLEIIPFVGNLTGTSLAILMAFTQGGGGVMALGILAVYAVVQFVQTYILEPLVVGSEVNINPLFTILIIVLGETVWGIPGMILAIPLLGITKIVFDNVESLKPWGYLIGEEKKDKSGLIKKVKSMFGKQAE